MSEPIVKIKRGRKSKKDLLLSLNMQPIVTSNIILNVEEISNINSNTNSVSDSILEPVLTITDPVTDTNDNLNKEVEVQEEVEIEAEPSGLNDSTQQKPFSKKRGRKPKGGKIIQQLAPTNYQKDVKPNIILHLKCSLKDLQLDPNNNIESFHFPSSKELDYNMLTFSNDNIKQCINLDEPDEEDDTHLKEENMKDIYKKLKQLEQNLHINNVNDKKSACFWCTYDFDNPAIYIPRYFLKDSYHVYGCFCSPECATAHLMEENIDSSTKFERYHFINHLYAKIYNYNRNIKPAPNPYYMLEKYYGNLSIQEYRALFKNERLFLIVDKPLTRILPELHEDNDDFILNNKIIPSNNYQIKKKIQRKPQTKATILNEKFGIV